MTTCYLIGIGMGNPETLTLGAARRIEACGQLIGARRMLDAFPDHPGRKLALIRAEEMAAAVRAPTASAGTSPRPAARTACWRRAW